MKKILGILILSFIVQICWSQDNHNNYSQTSPKAGFDYSKLEYGGNIGFVFGTSTHINISPQIGYKISPNFSAGISMGYNYYSYSDITNYKYNALSVGIYGRAFPINTIVLSVHPEISRIWTSSTSEGYKYTESKVAPSVLIGTGVRIQGILAMLEYDIVQNQYSPYGNRLFYSIGFCF